MNIQNRPDPLGMSSCGQKRRTSYPARTTVIFKHICAKKRHTSVSSVVKKLSASHLTRNAVRKDTRQISFSSKSSIGAFGSTGHLILLILLSIRCLRLFISVCSHCGSKCLHSSYKRRYCLRSVSSSDLQTLLICSSCSCNSLKMNSVSSTVRCCRKNFHIATPPGRSIKLSRQSLGGLVSRSRPSWKRPITVGSWSVYSMAQRRQKSHTKSGQKSHTCDLQEYAVEELAKHSVEMSNRAICEI